MDWKGQQSTKGRDLGEALEDIVAIGEREWELDGPVELFDIIAFLTDHFEL